MIESGPKMKVALVHDWLVTYRGGERVLESLCALYPEAPIFTLFHTPGSQPQSIESHRIVESPLARIPGARQRHRYFLPLYPWAIEQLDLREFDLVISTSHAVAKGAITRADALHICYVHAPMRYVWDFASEYFSHASLPVRFMASATAPFLRLWDESTAHRVDHFIANSETVRQRIHKRYRREAAIIHPPVDIARFSPGAGKRDYYLVVSALVPYKRTELVIEALAPLGRRLIIAGDGPERARLEQLANDDVQFVGALSAAELAELYRGARALLFPGEEDFGITPLEAMASGTPVIAYGRGGATETVIPFGAPHPTGLFFAEQTASALRAAIERFETLTFLPEDGVRRASGFSRERFEKELKAFLRSLEAKPASRRAKAG